ncbi:MAG: DEAD/DEAH box helicase family protein, partial [Gemmatimonadetes bacterium]|nr:DEAD/DEAH box helicase family protein [Gemmatimonadota bacterium]
MLRNEPTLRPGLFRLPDDPVAAEVLIPGFRTARTVRGAFGWFTAGWIERLAPGLAEYLNREQTGPIDFTVAPALYPAEHAAVERGVRITAQKAAELVVNVFVNGRVDASALGRHALDCLSWMIAKQILHMRIAVPSADSNYHPKIWLFDDGESQVLARGSGNATSRGVASGVEHLDVDVSWVLGSESRVREGIAMLDDWSDGASLGIEEVVDLPEALAREIVRIAPSSAPRPQDYTRCMPGIGTTQPLAVATLSKLQIPKELQWTTGPYAHQGEAVRAWEKGDISERGVIAMATGAGKTLTALICAARCQDRLGDKPFLVIVSAPSVPLIMQWQEEVRRFGVAPVVPNLSTNTDRALTQLFRALQGGGTQVVIVTNNLLCTKNFQATVAATPHSKPKPVFA